VIKKKVEKRKTKTEPAPPKVEPTPRAEAAPPRTEPAHEAPQPERHAHGVDADIKAENLRRLARIQGQVGGLARMVDAERYCPDILLQIDSVQEALRGVSRELLRSHLRHCAKAALTAKDKTRAEETIDELVELFQRYRR
jgi:CsoR family transcriptional regulator, copper-sensing transcriptional repressor